ncbi:MAG: hypothetical protein KatS3mg030_753 [Saprospiraceae bacterium]|nr:MAG: hypothetical protein KatS3mg030_753 [Saprospiraceae bacterium]
MPVDFCKNIFSKKLYWISKAWIIASGSIEFQLQLTDTPPESKKHVSFVNDGLLQHTHFLISVSTMNDDETTTGS